MGMLGARPIPLACGGDVASLTPELAIDTLVHDAFMVSHVRACLPDEEYFLRAAVRAVRVWRKVCRVSRDRRLCRVGQVGKGDLTPRR